MSTLDRRLLFERSTRLALRSFFFGPRISDKSGVERDMTSDEVRKRLMGITCKLVLFERLSSSGIVISSLGEGGDRDLSGEKLERLFVRSLMSGDSIGLFTLLTHGSELMVTFFSGLL